MDRKSPKFNIDVPEFRPTEQIAPDTSFKVDAEPFNPLSTEAPEFIPGGDYAPEVINDYDPASTIDQNFEELNLSGENVPLLPFKVHEIQPLQYHLYTNPLPNVINLKPNEKTIHSFFMSDGLREDLLRKNEEKMKIDQIKDQNTHKIITEVDMYHSLAILDASASSKVFGYSTSVYKAISSLDGLAYCLYRIEGYRVTDGSTLSVISKWKEFSHANVVNVREAFTSNAFGDNSLILVYDYHPLSENLFKIYFQEAQGKPLPENILWSFIVQLTNALYALHSNGLSSNMIEPSKILLTGKNRLRINCCGLSEILTIDQSRNFAQEKIQDIINLGHLIVCLATGSLLAVKNLKNALGFIATKYSQDLKGLLLYIFSGPPDFKSINEILTLISPRMLQELQAVHHYNDNLENELSKELENGRLVRLLTKLGFINERPEFQMDPSWSETGDRYLLKLFRDYVFHQTDEESNPILDIPHVLSCLNKLDAGFDEKIMLMSNDEQSCLIVSYKDLKQCVDSAFRELANKSSRI